jgi:pilus assembly protein CpaE
VSGQRLLVIDDSDELVQQVGRVTSTLESRPEVVSCDDLASLRDISPDRGSFDLVVAGSVASSRAGLRELGLLRERQPHTQLIVALRNWRGSSVRDIVRAGASDVLRLPVDDDLLLDAVEQALKSMPVSTNALDAHRSSRRKGTVTTVVSAGGGCGKTFLAGNLGYQSHKKFGRRTCLIDLDLQFGELGTALRLRPEYTIADLLSPDAENDDLGSRLEEYLVRHNSGVYLLAAPEEPAHADNIDAEAIGGVIEAARTRFDDVIVDVSTGLSDALVSALDFSDRIFALCTLDLPSVSNLGLLLSTLRKLRVPDHHVNLVLNKVEPDVGLDVNGVTRYLGQEISMVIPYGREVNRALNMGQPVLAHAPRSDVSKALTSGLSSLLGHQPAQAVGQLRPNHRWTRSRPKSILSAAIS